ncbi:hypothetical protein KBK19_09665 [Microvirga sp. STR05]|uniref:Tail specific protease domain-containing protein n=1 Tax=Hymenobacter duratus TaxID=2771356 RepID=A0ABR8JGU1_9BACT|nr:S41 family peptidase [Hymenobacter duratus]MBD2715302.1 hypothetical protein [Hymenobacter duratus]MBR7950209.1 hypothetical protein [Microvirga sp. STR05]
MLPIRYVWLLLLTFCAGALRAQTPALPASVQASPAAQSLTPRQVAGVAALGQLWGFLKYHHPAVAAGQQDWDATLLRQLPALLACRTTAEQRLLLGGWIRSLGDVPACPSCATPPGLPVHTAPDLRWARESRVFDAALRRQLAYIQTNRYQGEPYYVGKLPAGNASFPHEEAYANQACPEVGLRILALCRFWNMVEYYSPYKELAARPWARVLPELLPLFAAADTPLRYRHAVLRLLAELQDGHATLAPDALLDQEAGAYLVPAVVQFIGEQAVVRRVRQDGVGQPSPLAPGDIITHLNSVPVAELVRQRLPETPGSNRPARLRLIARELLVSPTPELTLDLLREGRPLRVRAEARLTTTLTPVPRAAADSLYRFLTPTVGYIDMAQVRRDKLPRMMQTFRQTRGLIIDLRNYPGDFVAGQLPGYFLPEPATFARYTLFDTRSPGRFLRADPDTIYPQAGPGLPYTGRVVVLVNEITLSQGEFTAITLRATPNCTILGSQTAGADGNRSSITLPGGLKTGMSGIGVFYPDGRPTQGVGIIPDVVVQPTPAGLRAGRDELRERALELLQRQ